MTRGRFITFEGVDGAGKSTHVPFAAERLRALGLRVTVTREPGGTPLAEKLRTLVLGEAMDAVAEALLLFAARADHVARVIAPALESGAWVLCDRFTDATAAYQGGGKGVSAELLERLADAVHPGLAPDRTLLFDCPYEIAAKRLAATGKAADRFEGAGREFFDRVRQAYLARARAEPARFRVIDASREVADIRKELETHLSIQ